jgi:alkylated DNA repair dioxygenase AlkB
VSLATIFFSLLVVAALFMLFSGLAIFASLGLESDNQNIQKIEPLPKKDQESMISRIPEEQLLLAIFTFTNDSKSMDVIRQHYYSNDGRNHYVMHSIRSIPQPLWLYDAFPTHKKMLLVQSLDNITDAIYIGQYYDLNTIVYDIEHWENTPELERANPSISISKGASIVHGLGYSYGITPDAEMLLDNYEKIDWTEIDFLGMQLQRFSQNGTEYSSIAEKISTFVRSRNPNIEIFTQLSFRFTDANDMIKAIEGVKDIVDGFIIAYDTNIRSDSCIPLDCSPRELKLVLDRINRLTRQ